MKLENKCNFKKVQLKSSLRKLKKGIRKLSNNFQFV